jgi:hypothetical protein
MASNTETAAVTALALLVLTAAVKEAEQALRLMTPSQNDEFAKHLDACSKAIDLSFENIKNLVDILGKHRE